MERQLIGDRWGATAAEVRASYPCDDYVPRASLQAWRAVSIEAAPSVVWSWIVQLRLAPYSYDWIDNLGRRSPRELLHLDDPDIGDPFSSAGGRPVGRVIAIQHGEHLTAQIMGATMTYRLAAVGDQHTRLVLKIVGDFPRILARVVSVGDLVMARRQLLNLKKYAERSNAT